MVTGLRPRVAVSRFWTLVTIRKWRVEIAPTSKPAVVASKGSELCVLNDLFLVAYSSLRPNLYRLRSKRLSRWNSAFSCCAMITLHCPLLRWRAVPCMTRWWWARQMEGRQTFIRFTRAAPSCKCFGNPIVFVFPLSLWMTDVVPFLDSRTHMHIGRAERSPGKTPTPHESRQAKSPPLRRTAFSNLTLAGRDPLPRS